MKNKGLLSLICLGVVLSLALPTEVLANTTEAYGAKDIVDIRQQIKGFPVQSCCAFCRRDIWRYLYHSVFYGE